MSVITLCPSSPFLTHLSSNLNLTCTLPFRGWMAGDDGDIRLIQKSIFVGNRSPFPRHLSIRSKLPELVWVTPAACFPPVCVYNLTVHRTRPRLISLASWQKGFWKQVALRVGKIFFSLFDLLDCLCFEKMHRKIKAACQSATLNLWKPLSLSLSSWLNILFFQVRYTLRSVLTPVDICYLANREQKGWKKIRLNFADVFCSRQRLRVFSRKCESGTEALSSQAEISWVFTVGR